MPRILCIAWLGLLGFSESLAARTPNEVRQFEVMRITQGYTSGTHVDSGVLSIAGGTVRYDPQGAEYSLEIPIKDVSKVTHNKHWVTIKRKNGKTYRFMPLQQVRGDPAPVQPLVEAITTAMNAPPSPVPEPERTPPPKPAFGPTPQPTGPAGPPAADGGTVAGRIPEQVKGAPGESAQTLAEAPRFRAMTAPHGFQFMIPHTGTLTIIDATLRFDERNHPERSLELPIEDISEVTGHTILKQVTIKLKNGKSYDFNVLTPVNPETARSDFAPVEPLVEALAVAMSAKPGPLPLPETTPAVAVRSFAPIPAPAAPADTPTVPGRAVVGQTQDQVKAALGHPDEIHLSQSATAGNKVVWVYKSLTATFVDGKVSAVEGAASPSPVPGPEGTIPPKPAFGPIPPPAAPVDAPAAPPRIAVGQNPDQVKAILGQPDRISLSPSKAKVKTMIWYYKSLTVLFVDGKVFDMEGTNRPPALHQ